MKLIIGLALICKLLNILPIQLFVADSDSIMYLIVSYHIFRFYFPLQLLISFTHAVGHLIG